MKFIQIKIRKTKEEIEHEARLILAGLTVDMGDDDVLDKAIEIACRERLDVVFMHKEKEVTPEMAYGIRYNSGLDIRP